MNHNSREFLRELSRLLVPLMIITVAVLWWIYRTEHKALLDLKHGDQTHAAELASNTILTELNLVRSDVLYLARLASVNAWLKQPTTDNLTQISADLMAYSRYRGIYDQVRFINVQGQEVVRINWENNRPVQVVVSKLQDKSTRPYVREALVLPPGDIYISPIDLNVEGGVVERPFKPVIRLATPVVDAQGDIRGLIVLNYFADRLLNNVHSIQEQTQVDLWLVNHDGYWLVGPERSDEWGFMFDDRQDKILASRYPELWQHITQDDTASYVSASEDLFHFRKIASPRAGISAGDVQWTLIAHVSAAVISDAMMQKTKHLLGAFLILFILLVTFSFVVVIRDLQRRHSESRLQGKEARFRGLLESAPDAIVMIDENGLIQLINAQAEQWFGYTRGELIGKPVEILIPERYREKHVINREAYCRDPVIRPMAVTSELTGRRKDGSEFPVEISLSPLKGEDGHLYISMIRDVTQHKQADEQRHQVQMRYQQLMQDLPVGVYRSDSSRQGYFLEVNPALVKMFEAESAEELIAVRIDQLYLYPEERQKFRDKILADGHIKGMEVKARSLKGREFYVSLTSILLQSAAGEPYFSGVVEDITSRKQSELTVQELNANLQARSTELEVINKELEAFSYSVSHDLRAPLRAMDGFSQSLLADYAAVLDDNGKDRLQRVRAAAQRMATLIDDLLALSRVSRAELHREPIDLGKIASEVVEELLHGEPARKVSITIQPEMNTNGDARLMRILMNNLIGNAWKFTGKCEEAVIELGTERRENVPVYYVKDNGAGFDMTYAAKLFGAFQRLHDTKEYPGTGIGLATVKRVINKHGGHIWAESEVNKGTIFYFTLTGQDLHEKRNIHANISGSSQ